MPLQEAVEQIHLTSLKRNFFANSEKALTTLKKEHWVSSDCENQIREITFGADRELIQVAFASLRALDFFEEVPWQDVFSYAKKKFHFKSCSKEDALDLRLQLDQRRGSSLVVCTEPMFFLKGEFFFNLKSDRYDGTSRICAIDLSKQLLQPDDVLAFRAY